MNQTEIHRMAQSWDAKENIKAIGIIQRNFRFFRNKERAWKDLLALTKAPKIKVRRDAAVALDTVFPHVTNKEQAWKDLLTLTKYKNSKMVRLLAVKALDSTFSYITDKQPIWEDLITLTNNKDSEARLFAVKALDFTISYITNKELVWKDLIMLTKNQDSKVRLFAVKALISVFPHIADKNQASNDLLVLTKDEDSKMRLYSLWALGSFSHDETYQLDALLELTKEKSIDVKLLAIKTIESTFPYIINKERVSKDLLALIKNQNIFVRIYAVEALGSVYPHITDKKQVLKNLLELTKDKDSLMRVYAKFSLGRIYIIKATEAGNKKDLYKELRYAIEFFEQSSIDSILSNPSKFCHAFYKLIYSVMFEDYDKKTKIQTYLEIAKLSIGESENKKLLLKIVNNLDGALKELDKANEMDLDSMKSSLETCQSYCDHAIKLLASTENTAPGATKLIRNFLPIIDERIKELLAEIKEKAETAYQNSKETPAEEIVYAFKQEVQKWQITNQEQMTRNVENLIFILKARIPSIQNNNKIHNEIDGIIKETNITKQYEKVSLLIGLIPTAQNIVEEGGILIMGDVFSNNQNATIINRTVFMDSFIKVKKEHNEEVAKALLQIAEFIEESGDINAGILFEKFNEELNQSMPDKSTIKKIWGGVEKTLPTINTLSDVIVKLSPLF